MALWRIVAISCACLLMVGCGDGGQTLSENVITGNVVYQGKPVTGGTVTFYVQIEQNESPTLCTGMIDDEGRYEVTYAVPGKARISVQTETEQGNPTYIKIPAKYINEQTSGLTYDVQQGKQEYDIFLE